MSVLGLPTIKIDQGQLDHLQYATELCSEHDNFEAIHLRLVFTTDRHGIVIRSVELFDLVKTVFWFFWSSENWVVGVASRSRRTKPITKHRNVHCDWSILVLLLYSDNLIFTKWKEECERWSCEQSWKKTGKVLILLTPIPSHLSLCLRLWVGLCRSWKPALSWVRGFG